MFDVLVPVVDRPGDRPSRIDLAVASIDLAGANSRSRARSAANARSRRRSPRSDRYDYIPIDTPPSLGLLTINAFVATGVIVPVQTGIAPGSSRRTRPDGAREPQPRVDIVGILPTMYDRRLTHSREADEILRENFGDLVYSTRIRKTIRFAEAPVKGSSVLAYEPDGGRGALPPGEGGAGGAETEPACVGPLAELFRATEAAQRAAAAGKAANGVTAADGRARGIRLSPWPRHEPADDAAPAGARSERGQRSPRWLEPLPERPARLERTRESLSYLAVIRVVGVGGAGLNALDRMMDAGITQADFVAVNTDIQQLQTSDAPTTVHIGSELTEGLAPAPTPRSGAARPRRYDQLKRLVRLGHGVRHRRRGRRHGLAPRRSSPASRASGRAHGRDRDHAVRSRAAGAGSRPTTASSAPQACDTVIVIPNDRLLEARQVHLDAGRVPHRRRRPPPGRAGHLRPDHEPGMINLDFADVRMIMKDAGSARWASASRPARTGPARRPSAPCAAADGHRARRRPRHSARSRADDLSFTRSTRPPRSAAPPRTTRTSSSAPPSTSA
jgi:hypothetical protein